MKIDRFDHVVLTVRDVDATCAFYRRVLGMEIVVFENGRKALHFGQQKLNLHKVGRELHPNALNAAPGSADLCFVTATPIAEVVAHLQACGAEILAGPVARTGALGPMQSVYTRDPDGNNVEIATYHG